MFRQEVVAAVLAIIFVFGLVICLVEEVLGRIKRLCSLDKMRGVIRIHLLLILLISIVVAFALFIYWILQPLLYW
jgi:hypothetical protein